MIHPWRHNAVGAVMTLVVSTVTTMSPLVAAWGKDGHEIIGNLAWYFLSSPTQQSVSDLLLSSSSDSSGHHYHSYNDKDDKDDNDSPLAQVADWADQVRRYPEYSWSGPLHYIDVRDDLIQPSGCPASRNITLNQACQFDYTRDCVDDVCVAGATVNYTHQLLHSSSSIPHEQRVVALKFVTHLVGDLHQPLHAARTTDRGGNAIHVHFCHSFLSSRRQRDSNHEQNNNKIRLDKDQRQKHLRQHHHHHHAPANLHAVWDDGFIDKRIADDFGGSRHDYEQFLVAWILHNNDSNNDDFYHNQTTSCGSPILERACTTQWAQESFLDAMAWAYRNVDGTEVQTDQTLGLDYYQTRLPVVERRLAAAGVRLAGTLEAIFSHGNDTF